jgi:hypothetical protein
MMAANIDRHGAGQGDPKMRLLSLLCVAVLAGCATSNQAAKAPAKAPAAVVNNTPGASQQFAKIDENNIAKAQAAGYKIVNEDGKTLYCKRTLVTGTRLHYQTECLTSEEIIRMNNNVKETFDHPTINMPPPGG